MQTRRQPCQELPVLAVERAVPEAGVFRLRLDATGWTPKSRWMPGQFVMLRPVKWGLDPIWGRAFSITSLSEHEVSVLVLETGRGTHALGNLSPGDLVTAWGPLGNGFALDPDAETLILAGGVGLASFLAYCAAHPAPEKLTVVFGHRMPSEWFPLHELHERSIRLETFLDRGPEDVPRFVELMARRMAATAKAKGLVLACGPRPFLRTVRSQALELGVRAQVSLENSMACGVGACLGCVCEHSERGPVQVCTNGPVFDVQDLAAI